MYIMNIVTLIGITVIFMYSLTQILKFYGVNEDIYGVYMFFYLLIVLSIIVLPNDYPKV
jgi:hypothetical protein